MANKAVFLDKDGTINEDKGYIDHPMKIDLLPNSAKAISLLNQATMRVLVVSNQAGVARGYFGEDMLQAIDKTIQKKLLASHAYYDGIYYCPHHPEFGHYPYKKDCECRKPNPGMLLKAADEYGLDLKDCYMIGDKDSDLEAGRRAGCKTVLVLTGYGEETQKNLNGHRPDFIAQDLLEAVNWILTLEPNSTSWNT
ncbi:MAG: HAD family hydrolase [Candidatus Saganbacteria bacterium]|nr:HAD family hydrolase [Candidatus Saganbacteria bacterium]